MFQLTSDPIISSIHAAGLTDTRAGAFVAFEGWVRNHNEGKEVVALEYQIYEALAISEGIKILDEAKLKFSLHQIECTHRYGFLKLGETAVWIGATASHRDDAFRATRYVIDQIKLRLPIWKKEHYAKETARWVFCRDHATHVHFNESDYYKKQARLTDQAKLRNNNVFVAGLGGLGCPVSVALATAGVGEIHIADFDRVSISNIHRQPLYSTDLVGEKKVQVAAQKLSSLNPFIKIHPHDTQVSALNIETLITGKDLVLDCTDNFETKYVLHDACMKLRIPLISASIFQFEGTLRTFIPGTTGCLRCLDTPAPEDAQVGNCNDFGVLGSAVSTLGNMQATEAILLLQELPNNSSRDTIYFNFKSLTQFRIQNAVNPSCSTCAGAVDLALHFVDDTLEVGASEMKLLNATFIDIRSEDESTFADFQNSTVPVVLYCDRGIRSKKLVRELRAKGHSNFYSLKGGACSL